MTLIQIIGFVLLRNSPSSFKPGYLPVLVFEKGSGCWEEHVAAQLAGYEELEGTQPLNDHRCAAGSQNVLL